MGRSISLLECTIIKQFVASHRERIVYEKFREKKRKSITLTSLHQTQKGITLITLSPDFLIATSLIRLTSFIDITDKNSEREKRSFDSKAILVFIYTVTYTCTALMRHINGEKKIDEVRITRDKIDLFPLIPILEGLCPIMSFLDLVSYLWQSCTYWFPVRSSDPFEDPSRMASSCFEHRLSSQ